MPDAELPILTDTDKVRALPVRKLNPNLPRKRIVREPSCACCPGCGGALRAMGEDSEEMLDLVAQAWQVIETVRPKYSCRTCDESSRRRHQDVTERITGQPRAGTN